MNPHLSALLAGLVAAMFTASVPAMPSGAIVEKGPAPYPMDCAKARDKARCAALNRKINACRDKTDDSWRECMDPQAPTARFTPPAPRDCSKAHDKEACKAHASALEACKSKHTRAEHRACVSAQLQAVSSKKE